MTTGAHAHVARMEVHAHGGPPEYDSVHINEVLRATNKYEARPRESVLRVFSANPWKKVTRPVQDILDAAAKALLWRSDASRADQALASAWNAARGRATFWFAFNTDSYPLQPLSLNEVAEFTRGWTRPDPARTREFLVEVQRGPSAPSFAQIIEAFRESITIHGGPAQVTTSAHVGAVSIVPAVQTPTAPADPAAAAAALREELLALDWPTSEAVGRHNHSGAGNPAQWAAAKRASGELLGVWSPRDRTYRHPSFQFHDGLLSKRVKELLTVLNALPGFNSVDDASGWRRAFWLYGERSALADKAGRPRSAAAVFPDDPERVIALARTDAEVDPNDHW